MKRSIGAVLAGLISIVILSGVISAILTQTDVFPKGKLPLHGSLSVVMSILVYQVIIYAVGCFATVKLAPQDPMQHVLVLGGLGTILNLASGLGLATKNGVVFFWFYLSLAVLSLLTAWVSGKLYGMKKPKAEQRQ
jgi:hypothetical protein